ncbi:MAG: selenophosphate synthetase-related protein [Nitrospinales bacterium]|jgi:selenophosphate synthetase-related protein
MKKRISSRSENLLQVTLTVRKDCLVIKTGDNEILIPKKSPLFQAVEKSTDKAATFKAILVIAQVAHFGSGARTIYVVNRASSNCRPKLAAANFWFPMTP